MTKEADKVFSGPCEFLLAASDPKQFPDSKMPEVAFWGRSNAGKSSLINALVNRKIAFASKTPGRTQQIVFFNLGGRLMMVDLPGYGHANAPHEEQELWDQLIHHYMQTRPPLRCVCLLTDGRHGLLANDLAMMQRLDRAGAAYQIVMTKADLVKPAECENRRRQIASMLERHPAARPGVLLVSAEKHQGLEELRQLLLSF